MVEAIENRPLDLIYIMGSGRSGGTLLSQMLNRHPCIFSVGEVYNYQYFFLTVDQFDRLCSCGERLNECDFWSAVNDELGVKTDDDLLDLKLSAGERFINNNYLLLSAVRKQSRCDIIVDSSKRHYRLQTLLSSGLFNVVIIHLIRDPRAYAYSSMLTEMRKGSSSNIFFKKLIDWTRKNFGIWLIYGWRKKYLRMRYEDLVEDPQRQMQRLIELLSKQVGKSSFNDPSGVSSHEFSGNSRSIKKGLAEVKLDTRYLSGVTTKRWFVASLIVVPITMLFRYPIFSRRTP